MRADKRDLNAVKEEILSSTYDMEKRLRDEYLRKNSQAPKRHFDGQAVILDFPAKRDLAEKETALPEEQPILKSDEDLDGMLSRKLEKPKRRIRPSVLALFLLSLALYGGKEMVGRYNSRMSSIEKSVSQLAMLYSQNTSRFDSLEGAFYDNIEKMGVQLKILRSENSDKVDSLEKTFYSMLKSRASRLENTIYGLERQQRNNQTITEGQINEIRREVYLLQNAINKYGKESAKIRELEAEVTGMTEKFSKLKLVNIYTLDDVVVDDDYNVIIVEKDLEMPFNLSQEAIKVATSIRKSSLSDEEKARKIFGWVESNIRYGESKRKIFGVGYRNSNEVLKTKEGVCGEMAYVYVTMARLAGLESSWVHVSVDNRNESVSHACASVNLNGRTILVDPAYHTYDIHHTDYDIMNDSDAISKFRRMRN